MRVDIEKRPLQPRSDEKRSKVPTESKKRQNDHISYTLLIKEMEIEIRAENGGKIFCFFTGREIEERVSWHHTNKRIGEFYLDKRWLVPTINEYHLMYHHTSVEKLSKEPWYYTVFIPNLEKLSSDLVLKEKKKFEKAGLLFGS